MELLDGDFLKVFDLIQDGPDSVLLRGWLFRRTRVMNGLLERKINELCWIMHIDEDDPKDHAHQSMVSVPVSIVKRRRKIRLTNQPFPIFSFREDDAQDTQETILNERVLVCRSKYICFYANAQARERYMWSEKAIHRLRAEECDSTLAELDHQLRRDWRGKAEREIVESSYRSSLILPGHRDYADRGLHSQESSRFGSDTVPLSSTATLSRSSPTEEDDIEPDTCFERPVQGQTRNSVRPDHAPRTARKRRPYGTSQKFVDLTDNGYRTRDAQRSTPDAIHNSIIHILSQQLARKASIETVDIDLQISTTTKAGTLKRRYKGEVSTAFIPNTLPIAERGLSNTRRTEPVPKKAKKRHETTPLPSPIDGAGDLGYSRSPTPYRQESDSLDEPYTSICSGIQASSEESLPSPCQGSRPYAYTFGDCFCGGGGMSRGAAMAGLNIQWGFDFNKHACGTYAANFLNAVTHNLWAHEFSGLDGEHQVDICHLSPPCQFFSDAHTVMGKDDDMNTASLFAIMELLKKIKPRAVTLEQTSGLLRRHELYFNAVIQIFTSMGFSIRWRLINCADYGLPQQRCRIFIIASCPGEPLPSFPKPTHASGAERGLKRYATVNCTIANIPAWARNHSPSTALARFATPWNGDALARCITTTGGHMIHPSGTRDFTHREFACLQGFPLEHRFGKSFIIFFTFQRLDALTLGGHLAERPIKTHCQSVKPLHPFRESCAGLDSPELSALREHGILFPEVTMLTSC